MTEPEWLACNDPTPMLRYLDGKASERKLRLFAVSCCRRIWHVLTDKVGREAVDVAERFADGAATRDDLLDAGDATVERLGEIRPFGRDDDDYSTYCAVEAALSSLGDVEWTLASAGSDASLAVESRETELTEQAHLIRDVFGNPFSPAVVQPSWLTSTVLAIAAGTYVEKAFDRLPILADALQDAGCDSDDLLSHLRSDGPHVKGCWALDLVLGKS